MNIQSKYSNKGLHLLAESCSHREMSQCIELIDHIIKQEKFKEKFTGFTFEEGIKMDDVIKMLAHKNRTDKKASVDIVIVTHKNFVTLVEAKFDVSDAKNISHKEMNDKIRCTRSVLNDCDYSHNINRYTYVLLSENHYEQNVSRFRKKMSNDPKIKTWKVSDFLNFMKKDSNG